MLFRSLLTTSPNRLIQPPNMRFSTALFLFAAVFCAAAVFAQTEQDVRDVLSSNGINSVEDGERVARAATTGLGDTADAERDAREALHHEGIHSVEDAERVGGAALDDAGIHTVDGAEQAFLSSTDEIEAVLNEYSIPLTTQQIPELADALLNDGDYEGVLLNLGYGELTEEQASRLLEAALNDQTASQADNSNANGDAAGDDLPDQDESSNVSKLSVLTLISMVVAGAFVIRN